MAQYIDLEKRFNFNMDANPKHLPWKSHTWRQVCREMSGIRGCAPAVQKRTNLNDGNSSVNAEDDRIFHAHIHKKIYIWGVEMYAGGYDTLRVKWRSLGASDDFVSIKGIGCHYADGVDAFYADSEWSVEGASVGKGTPKDYLESSNGFLSYPAQSFEGFSSNPYADNDERIYFQELSPYSSSLAAYGPDDQYLQQAAYTTISLNNIRSFVFLKEGEYLFEIVESASPWYNFDQNENVNPYSDPYYDPYSYAEIKSKFHNPQEPYGFYESNTYSPILYSSNQYLYGTNSEWINNNIYSYNSFVKNSGQIYRSCFTKKILIKVFNENVDLSSGDAFTYLHGKVKPNSILTNYYVYAPYANIKSYGSEWISSIETKNKFFVSTSDSIESLYYTDVVKESDRFSNEQFRYSKNVSKNLVNRRHTVFRGLSIFGYNQVVNFDETGIDNASNQSADKKYWYVDYRGSVFEDCTFKNVNFNSSENKSIFSGCSFINCKFYNCILSISADSALFEKCLFSGFADSMNESSNFELWSGNSNLFVECNFENLNTLFSVNCLNGPVCDNAWFKCCISLNTTAGKDSGLLYFKYDNANIRYFDLNKFAYLEQSTSGSDDVEWTAKYRHECSRNMFFDNRIYDGALCSLGSKNAYCRGNFYWGNVFSSPVFINYENSIDNKSASLHDVFAYNVFNKLNLRISDNVMHLRFLNNVVNEPHQFSSSGFYGGYRSDSDRGVAWMSAIGEYEKEESISPWYCRATYSMGNKLINNMFINWSREYMDSVPTATFYSKLACSMSVYQNFFLVNKDSYAYNQIGLNADYNNTLLDDLDEFSTPGTDDGIGRFVNMAYKNVFYLPYISGRLQDPFDGINPNPLDLDFRNVNYDKNPIGLCRAIYKKQYRQEYGQINPYDAYESYQVNPYEQVDPYALKQVIFENFYRIDILLWNYIPNQPPNLG